MEATIGNIALVLGIFVVAITIAIGVVVYNVKRSEKSAQEKIDEQNWMPPEKWGAKTNVQKTVLAELRNIREAIKINFKYYPHKSIEECFKILEDAEIKVKKYNLDYKIIVELARTIHSCFIDVRDWDSAIKIAQKYNL